MYDCCQKWYSERLDGKSWLKWREGGTGLFQQRISLDIRLMASEEVLWTLSKTHGSFLSVFQYLELVFERLEADLVGISL